MDITLELKQVISKEQTHNEIIEQFKKELKDLECNSFKNLLRKEISTYIMPFSRDENKNNEEEHINKKLHIFKVLELENLIDNIYGRGLFKKYSINKLEVYCADLISETSFQILCFNDEQFIKDVEPIIKIQELTSKLKDFDIDNISAELKEADTLHNQSIFLNVDKEIGPNIRELLLSNELKVVLDTNLNYVQLNNELGNSSHNNTKKIKI